jgi:poly[(R)-3-hydroxyalkanoate] polymerase subunit PhaC
MDLSTPGAIAVPQSAPEDRERRPIDRALKAAIGRASGGLSLTSLSAAYADWFIHLLGSPGKQQQLIEKAWRKSALLASWMAASARDHCEPCICPLPQDRRFSDPSWQQWPYNAMYQAFLLGQQWWHVATTGVAGVTPHHEQVVEFATRQIWDIASPANYVATNPEVLQQTVSEGGMNLLRGTQNWWEDMTQRALARPPVGTESFAVGQNLAVTPGKVVLRNPLIELIQYTPTTAQVHPEPILIVPAWIMKYYILDLSAHNSLVKYLVDQGHTVFMISWKNPDANDRDLGLADYLALGLHAALDAIAAIVPNTKVHACGYCLGGTLLAIAGAGMARDGDDRLASITLLAAQTDFEEPGELSLFIDDSQVTLLEDMMWDQGYLSSSQMAGAFQLLNSQDLIWSRLVRNYLLGRRIRMTDLMAWNADATRMPYRMHSEYLRSLFLNNDLAEGRFYVRGKPVALADVRVPFFVVGTTHDHVAPWPSVFKIQLLTDPEVTFVLTKGGHNAGIVSEPGHPGRSYQLLKRAPGARFRPADEWAAVAPAYEGSWWTAWHEWLSQHSGACVAPPVTGATERGYPPLGDAPGRYVHVR